MSENILEASRLRKEYGDAKGGGAFLLNDVSFVLPTGYIMGFIGPNGSGKTTTIKLILDVMKKDGGSVKLFGTEETVLRNEDIGVVLDAPLYAEEWTVNEVEKAVSPFYKKWEKIVFADYVKKFQLDPKKKVKDLSRGMKVKLQIAVALSHQARLLILDEPTSGLDPVARDEICDLLRAFVSDETKGVLFSTHITSDLEKTADYISFILNGTIVYTGTTQELLEKYARVTGGLDDINEMQKQLIIGYRRYGSGFEGMIETADMGKFSGDVLTEEISLEQIIIFMNKGVSLHE